MPRLFCLALFFAAGAAIGVGACSSFSEEDEDNGAADAGDAAEVDTSQVADTSDAPPIRDAAAESDGTYASPLVAVPVLGAPFAIEATEVTVAQFRAFVLKSGTDAGNPWPECAGKKALGPNPVCQQGSDDTPVVCVDFCDAKAYCESIGRRICGALGGGGEGRGHETDRTTDQWFVACSGTANMAYAYGATSDPNRCNTREAANNRPVPASTFPTCEGAEIGLLNMSGNVNEWEDACSADGFCVVRGGTFGSPADDARCSANVAIAASTTGAGDVGIRCCAGP